MVVFMFSKESVRSLRILSESFFVSLFHIVCCRSGLVSFVVRKGFAHRFRDCFFVVEISRLLCQKEDMLVRLRAAVRDALRHRIRFFPNNFLAEIPSIGAECESKHPRNPDEVFRF